MGETEWGELLARFEDGGRGIGFAVLGGAFAEGIDLVGSRLVGAFIATLAMPPLKPVNEELRRRAKPAFGDGYGHAYLYQTAKGGAGRRSGRPLAIGPGQRLPDRRPVRASRGAAVVAWVVGDFRVGRDRRCRGAGPAQGRPVALR